MANAYAINMSAQTIIADSSVICLRAATALSSRGSVLKLIEARVSQQGTSTSQQLGVIIGQKVSAFGTFTSTTPSPLVVGGVASGITGSTSARKARAR